MKLTLAHPRVRPMATNTRPGTQRRTRNTTRMDATHTHMEERDRTVSAYQCPDCRTTWPSRTAADECAALDAEEARDARRPSTRTVRHINRRFDD